MLGKPWRELFEQTFRAAGRAPFLLLPSPPRGGKHFRGLGREVTCRYAAEDISVEPNRVFIG